MNKSNLTWSNWSSFADRLARDIIQLLVVIQQARIDVLFSLSSVFHDVNQLYPDFVIRKTLSRIYSFLSVPFVC